MAAHVQAVSHPTDTLPWPGSCPRVPGTRGGSSTAAGERAPVPRCNGAELSPPAAKRRGQDPGGLAAAHGASGPPAPVPRLLFARRGWKAVRKRVRSTKRAERLPPACCGQRRTRAHDMGWERGNEEPGASSLWGPPHPGVFCQRDAFSASSTVTSRWGQAGFLPSEHGPVGMGPGSTSPMAEHLPPAACGTAGAKAGEAGTGAGGGNGKGVAQSPFPEPNKLLSSPLSFFLEQSSSISCCHRHGIFRR